MIIMRVARASLRQLDFQSPSKYVKQIGLFTVVRRRISDCRRADVDSFRRQC